MRERLMLLVDRKTPASENRKMKRRGNKDGRLGMVDSEPDGDSSDSDMDGMGMKDQGTMLLGESHLAGYSTAAKLKGDMHNPNLVLDPDRSMSKMKELSSEIKGKGGLIQDDQKHNKKDRVTALQRNKINEILQSQSSEH